MMIFGFYAVYRGFRSRERAKRRIATEIIRVLKEDEERAIKYKVLQLTQPCGTVAAATRCPDEERCPDAPAGPQADGAGDEANNDKLLAALEGVDDRGAAFHCVATYVEPGAEPLIARGEWRGAILRERRGDGGFGYDPLFYVPECRCSSAELPPAEKNARSHRGQALRELVRLVKQKYA